MSGTGLSVTGITLDFAGVRALDGVSFEVRPDTVHAVIGPNGAGKTSCFNVISGVYRPGSGTIRLGGQELTGLPPHRIARLGVGRAFQNNVLSARQTVRENLMLGRHIRSRAGIVATGLGLPSARRERRDGVRRVTEIAELVGLADVLDQPAGLLSYGDQKRVEMARALAMEPSVLLLDEPVAGMNDEETARTGEVIRAVRERTGVSVLLIEHDMTLVMGISDRITVLDFGRVVGDGTPAEVRNNPEVLRAYLGGAPDSSGATTSDVMSAVEADGKSVTDSASVSDVASDDKPATGSRTRGEDTR